jgi:ribosomal-protein-alanine N-acetyltransferase
VRAAFDRADAGGALRALLEVRASNEAAQHLYARFGFRVLARRSHYYMQPTEDALIMGCEMRDVSEHV